MGDTGRAFCRNPLSLRTLTITPNWPFVKGLCRRNHSQGVEALAGACPAGAAAAPVAPFLCERGQHHAVPSMSRVADCAPAPTTRCPACRHAGHARSREGRCPRGFLRWPSSTRRTSYRQLLRSRRLRRAAGSTRRSARLNGRTAAARRRDPALRRDGRPPLRVGLRRLPERLSVLLGAAPSGGHDRHEGNQCGGERQSSVHQQCPS